MNVLIVDEHLLFREGLKLMLAEIEPGVAFYEAASVAEAQRVCRDVVIDLALVEYFPHDVELPELTAALKGFAATAQCVAISADCNPARIRGLIDGSLSGFIPKTSSRAVLIAAIKLVRAGGVYIPPFAFANNLKTSVQVVDPIGVIGKISARQRDVVQRAMTGISNKVIAKELGIVEATVKAHLSAVYRLMGVRNRTEAIMIAAGLEPMRDTHSTLSLKAKSTKSE